MTTPKVGYKEITTSDFIAKYAKLGYNLKEIMSMWHDKYWRIK